jgi:hypothetical protein
MERCLRQEAESVQPSGWLLVQSVLAVERRRGEAGLIETSGYPSLDLIAITSCEIGILGVWGGFTVGLQKSKILSSA